MANIEKLSGRLRDAYLAVNEASLIVVCAHAICDEPSVKDMLRSVQNMTDRIKADLEALEEKALKNEKAVKSIAKIVQ